MTTTKIATSNIQKGLGWAPLRAAALRMLNQNADIIGFQEIYDHRLKALRKLMARKGYGLVMQNGVPIAYDLSRYKMVASNARRLPGKAIPGNSARFGTWVALKDRETGQMTVMTNTHLSRKRTEREQRWHRQQLRELGDLQRDLRERFGPDANYFMTGDFNNGKLGKRHFGLKGNRMKGHPIDYIFSERRPKRTWLMETASDHDTFFATFKDGGNFESDLVNDGNAMGGNGNGGGGNGGGGGGGGNGGNGGGGNGGNGLGAFDLFTDLLESWGIPVGNDIKEIIRNAMLEGITPDQIDLIIPDIQNTMSWKLRFPGWHERVANGYNQLTVEGYLQLENAYHRIMQEAGLPMGFYDDPSDFGKWIANDVSPDEIQNRVGLAVDAAKQIDPTVRTLMASHYGLTTGDVASYFLDQERALPVIQRQYQSANVAAWAQRAGFTVTNMGRYEDLVDKGVTAEQAASAYGTIASLSDSVGNLASIYGDTYDQGDAEADVFFGRSEKRRRLVSQEAGTFGGRSQGATGSTSRNAY